MIRREFCDSLVAVVFTGVEVSSDCIPEIPKNVCLELIGKARGIGLEVFTEVGYKVVGACSASAVLQQRLR